MEKEMRILNGVLTMFVISVISGMFYFILTYNNKPIEEVEYIRLDSLEARVARDYGEGDAFVEQMLYLKTGKHTDFMGRAYVYNYDCHINLSDSGTFLYDIYGKFIDFVPRDDSSQWDRAINCINYP